jgi:subtilisin family serine protease
MNSLLDALRRRNAEQPLATSREGALPPWELRFVLETDGADPESGAAALLGAGSYELRSLFPKAANAELARFHLLRFPGLDRRLFRRDELFELAHELARSLHLRSAEPDLGEAHFAEAVPPAGALVEGASDLAFWCWVDGDAPEDRGWALQSLRVPQAWAIAPGRGAGVRVAQPDTGVAAHSELDGAPIRQDLSADLVDGDADATDPLLASAGNPGHGTGTASVLISGPGGQVLGTAPGAELVPIRCIESVAVFDQSRVALALDHARRAGAHVVTMSLGGVPSRALQAALRLAVEEGCVVLAAAGNCIGAVVWPARYRDCIAVGGANIRDEPWRGSSRGAAVDIAAPGEFVWRALRCSPGDRSTHEISGGQGTSFATALTAGVVALWLSHHGRDRLLAEARHRGMTLADLCRAALAATARVPPGWDTGYGAGIADAEALLLLDPSRIPAPPERAEEEDELDLATLLPSALGYAVESAAPGLDKARFGLEVATLSLDAARALAGPAPERAAPRISPSLLAATRRRDAPASADGSAVPNRDGAARLAAPVLRAATEERGRSLGSYLRILSRAVGSSLESAGSLTEAAEAVRPQTDALLRHLELRFARDDAGQDPPDEQTRRLRTQVLDDAGRALDVLTRRPEALSTDRRFLLALEALVRIKGRPSLLVRDGTYDPADPELDEDWSRVLDEAGPRLPALIRSACRVDLDGEHVGSGFVVAPGLVMTNRHVLEDLVVDQSGRDGWQLLDGAEVDFDAEVGTSSREPFRVLGVAFAGPDPIGGVVNLQRLDLALLEVKARNATDTPLPPPVNLVGNAAAGRGRRDLAVVGYPARPRQVPRTEEGRINPEIAAALERIFRFKYGVKRLALGRVDRRLGTVAGDASPPWAISHDATTLGGNSGSAAALLEPDEEGVLPVLALHMGGQWLQENYAHVLAAVPKLRDIPGLAWRSV